MLIGVWGWSALGKTTWLHSIKDELKTINRNIVVVFADNALEFRPFRNDWFQSKHKVRWQGAKEEKLQLTLPDIIISKKIWIIESMRWFSGLQPYMVDAYNDNGKLGLYMITVWAELQQQREFIRQRCIKVGKPMSTYWNDDKKVLGETGQRVNSIKKWWEPNNVPNISIQITQDRLEWKTATKYLKEVIKC